MLTRRSPHGERGLKSDGIDADVGDLRSPHGERGLKCVYHLFRRVSDRSLSSWRAWIEIRVLSAYESPNVIALLMESVD